jgi:cytochrome c2
MSDETGSTSRELTGRAQGWRRFVGWRATLALFLFAGGLALISACGEPTITSEQPPVGVGVTGPLLSTPSAEIVQAGREYFLWGPCGECHTIDGTRAQGQVGPNMTNFGSRPRVNILPNTPDNVRKWLSNPQAVNPQAYMPNLNLPGDIIGKLTAFIETLR